MNILTSFLITLFIAVLLFLIVILTKKLLNKSDEKENLDNNEIKQIDENNFYYEIENALTDEECNILIKNAKDKLFQSKLMSSNDKNNYEDETDTSIRSSYQAWLSKDKFSNISKKVENIVNKYSNFKVNKSQFEDIQVVRYQPKQEYKYHYDVCHPYQAHKEHLKSCKADYNNFKSMDDKP